MAAPQNNNNAEVWKLEDSIKVFNDAIAIAKDLDDYVIGSGQNQTTIQGYKFHYLGEIASELDLYVDLYLYLSNKFPECKTLYNKIKTKLESNCFSDSKKGIIKEATAIMNLKSNYGWTDRQQIDQTTTNTTSIKLDKTDIDSIIDKL